MAKTLRFLAHTNGAALVYTSNKDKSSLTSMRNLLSQYLLKGPPVRAHLLSKSVDFTSVFGQICCHGVSSNEFSRNPYSPAQSTTPILNLRGILNQFKICGPAFKICPARTHTCCNTLAQVKTKVTDHLKALMIPPGADSIKVGCFSTLNDCEMSLIVLCLHGCCSVMVV